MNNTKLRPRRRIGTRRHLREWSDLLASLRIFDRTWKAQPTPPEKALGAVTKVEGSRVIRRYLRRAARPLAVLHCNEQKIDDLQHRVDRLREDTVKQQSKATALEKADGSHRHLLPEWMHWGMVVLAAVAELPFISAAYSVLPADQRIVTAAAVAVSVIAAGLTVVIGGAGGRLVGKEGPRQTVREFIVIGAAGLALFVVVSAQSHMRERYLDAALGNGGQGLATQAGPGAQSGLLINLAGIGRDFRFIQLGLLGSAILTGVVAYSPLAAAYSKHLRIAKRKERRARRLGRAMEAPTKQGAEATQKLDLLRLDSVAALAEVTANCETTIQLVWADTAAAHPLPIDPAAFGRAPEVPGLTLPELPKRYSPRSATDRRGHSATEVIPADPTAQPTVDGSVALPASTNGTNENKETTKS